MKNFARRIEAGPWWYFPIWLLLFFFGWRCRHHYSRGMLCGWTRCYRLDGHEDQHVGLDVKWTTGDHWEIRL